MESSMTPLLYDATSAVIGRGAWCEMGRSSPVSDPIRAMDRASIRSFLEEHKAYLKGRVLDFGGEENGGIVEGEYFPHRPFEQLPGGYHDAVICSQVLGYVDDPEHVLRWAVRANLHPGGHALITYAANGTEDGTDKWRFTKAGMEQLLKEVSLTVSVHELRAVIAIGEARFPVGYGVVCRK
jgi:hypothetical protein